MFNIYTKIWLQSLTPNSLFLSCMVRVTRTQCFLGSDVYLCQTASKSIEWLKHNGHYHNCHKSQRFRQTEDSQTDRQTDHATEKWVGIGEIACAPRCNSAKKYRVQTKLTQTTRRESKSQCNLQLFICKKRQPAWITQAFKYHADSIKCKQKAIKISKYYISFLENKTENAKSNTLNRTVHRKTYAYFNAKQKRARQRRTHKQVPKWTISITLQLVNK